MNLYLQFVLRYLNPISKRNSFSSSASLLAIAGLSIGVFALILTMSIIRGFELTLEKKISSIDGLFRIQNIFGELVDERDKLDSTLISKNLNIDINRYVRGSAIIRKGNLSEGILIEGVNKLPNNSYFDIPDKFIGDKLIIGKSLCTNLGLKIGDRVIISPIENNNNSYNIKFNSIEIGGIFNSGMPEYDKTLAYVSLEKAKTIFNIDKYISGFIINSSDLSFKDGGQISDHVKYPLYIESWKDRHQIIFDWIKVQRLPIIIIFGLIALVGIVNILGTISMIINEKSRQIGILMAQGMRKENIRKIFLLYGGVIGFFGCSIGSLFSYLFIKLQNKYKFITLPEDIYFMDHIPVKFDFNIFILIFIISIFISFISSIFPTKTIFSIEASKVLIQE